MDRGVRRGDGTIAVSCPHHADNGPVGAPALVFVGSLGTTLAMWEPQIRELSSRFRTIAIDLPGHGGTPVPEARCTVTGFADDVVRLLDSIGVEQFAIVGLSFGGAVAQALAAAYPDRVCAAVIACAAAQYSEEFWRTRAAHVRAEGLEEIVRLTAGRRFSPGFAEREPDTYAVSLAMLATMSPEGYGRTCGGSSGNTPTSRSSTSTRATNSTSCCPACRCSLSWTSKSCRWRRIHPISRLDGASQRASHRAVTSREARAWDPCRSCRR